MSAVSERRAARATWKAEVTRADAASEDDDDLYWLQLSPAERLALTWELSRELYSLAARNGGVFDEETGQFLRVEPGDLERRLPRADLVITRR